MIICKNNTSTLLTIRLDGTDIISIKPGAFTDISIGRSVQKLAASVDLAEKIIQKKVIINNGSSDLVYLDALDYIRYQQKELPINDKGEVVTAITTNKPFNDALDFRTRIRGQKGIMLAGATTVMDYDLTEERFINGVQLILKNHKTGDSVDFFTIDKLGTFTGIYYPPGTPLPVFLDQFGESVYVCEDKQDQGQVLSSYPARLVPGVSVRIVYHSTGTEDVELYINKFMHKRGPLI